MSALMPRCARRWPALTIALLAAACLGACGNEDSAAEGPDILDEAVGDADPVTDTTALPDLPADVPATDVPPPDLQPTDVGCVSNADCPVLANPCLANTCQVAVGCVPVARLDDVLCDDGDACTVGDVCAGGLCKAGPVKACTDGNPCTSDACAVGACTNPPLDGAPCDDGNACTSAEVCAAGACAGGALVCACQNDADCKGDEDGNVCNGRLFCNLAQGTCHVNTATVISCQNAYDSECLKNTCDAKSGACAMQPAVDATPCDDGNACTGNDGCSGGKCAPGKVNLCSCKNDADCAAKDDGNFCNGTLYCNVQLAEPACQLNKASVVVCQSVDDTVCAKNTCQPKTGAGKVTAISEGKACDADGNPCTPDESARPAVASPAPIPASATPTPTVSARKTGTCATARSTATRRSRRARSTR